LKHFYVTLFCVSLQTSILNPEFSCLKLLCQENEKDDVGENESDIVKIIKSSGIWFHIGQ